MTDNDIIKALECISGKVMFCKNCAYNKSDGSSYACMERAAKDALDLINRLKAENEALISAQETLQKHIAETDKKYALAVAEREANVKGFTETINKIKTEAIKEFAERLKANITINNTEDGYLIYSVDYNCLMDDIDDLVKEMVGEDE